LSSTAGFCGLAFVNAPWSSEKPVRKFGDCADAAEMQNAKVKTQNEMHRSTVGRQLIPFCILHFEFCFSVIAFFFP
jgi:hypothetical protein